MLYRILGPLEVRDGDRVIELPRRKHRELLAVLLARPNEVVPDDYLIEQLWADRPPARARAALQVCVSELRRTLQPEQPARSRGTVLVRHPPGYRLIVAEGTLDTQEFESLVGRARQACQAGHLERGAAMLRDALGLWRGPVLADVAVDEVERMLVPRLQEARLRALDERIDVDLQLGRHDDLVAELAPLLAEHPFRERLHGQLMVALYRCDRQAEALEVFRNLRERLANELGIEPGPARQQLHQAILAGTPAEQLSPPLATTGNTACTLNLGRRDRPVDAAVTRSSAPAQLPSDIDAFTGRTAELDQVRTHLASTGTATAKVCAISGAGGVGKSALAIHAAHVLKHQFPDGQLYANLHGATVGLKPLEPSEVLGRWSRAFGVDSSSVPLDTDEAAARLRSLLAGRRVLVVCDNAVDASQVRPLLPAGAQCGALVTSRRVLATLDNAWHLQLDTLSEQDAVTLLDRLAGAHRVAAEPEAAAAVARLCGHLPLAIRIAGAKLATHPSRSIGALAELLADERSRLDELQAADLAMASSFGASYRDLCTDPDAGEAARMFRLLGLNTGTDIGTPAAAALAGITSRRAQQLLDQLTEVHLVEHSAGERYRLHDLLRIYASERAADEPDDEQTHAVRRMLCWYLHAADAADRVVTPRRPRAVLDPPDTVPEPPTFTTYEQALAWLDTERPNLVSAARQAAETGHHTIAWKLPVALSVYFYMRKPWTDWTTIHHIGLTAARRLHEPFGEAANLTGLGAAHYELHRFQQAIDQLQQAYALWRDIGDRWAEALTLSILGAAYRDLQRPDQAITCFRQAMAIWPEISHPWGKGVTLHNLAGTYRQLGQSEQAIAYLEQAIALRRELPDRYGEAGAIHDLGDAYQDLHQTEKAIAQYEQALAIRRDIGDRYGEAQTLCQLAKAIHDAGKPNAAREPLREALAILEDLNDPRAADIRAELNARP